MSFWELCLVAVSLSMDAFAIAACAGLTMPRVTLKKCVIVGLYFGISQALMPVFGWMLATRFADKIIAYDHWITFALLSFIGGKMIAGSFKKEGCSDRECPAGVCLDRTCPGGVRPSTIEYSLAPAKMLPLAISTSIDALAVGVTFAFLPINIAPAASFIGITTFVLSIVGVKVGNIFGIKFKSGAEIAGGVILILIGLKILLEHMGILW